MEKKKYHSGNWHELNRNDIDMAIKNLVFQLNLLEGSAGDMDLYVLIRNYLRNETIRQEINKVLRERGAI